MNRPSDPLECQILEAIERAGTLGLTDGDADRLFGRQRSGAKRGQVFTSLKDRGLVRCERTAGGGALWKSIACEPECARRTGQLNER